MTARVKNRKDKRILFQTAHGTRGTARKDTIQMPVISDEILRN